jgi:hypothetical protein
MLSSLGLNSEKRKLSDMKFDSAYGEGKKKGGGDTLHTCSSGILLHFTQTSRLPRPQYAGTLGFFLVFLFLWYTLCTGPATMWLWSYRAGLLLQRWRHVLIQAASPLWASHPFPHSTHSNPVCPWLCSAQTLAD